MRAAISNAMYMLLCEVYSRLRLNRLTREWNKSHSGLNEEYTVTNIIISFKKGVGFSAECM